MDALFGRRIAHMVGHWNTFLIGQKEHSIAVVDYNQIDVGGLPGGLPQFYHLHAIIVAEA